MAVDRDNDTETGSKRDPHLARAVISRAVVLFDLLQWVSSQGPAPSTSCERVGACAGRDGRVDDASRRLLSSTPPGSRPRLLTGA